MHRLAHRVVARFASETSFEVDWSSSSMLNIRLLVGGQFAGSIQLQGGPFTRGKPNKIKDRCMRLVDQMSADGGYADQFWYVWQSDLKPEWRGKGYGKALYERAFAELHRKVGDAYVAPMECHSFGDTTPDAKRVWKSLRSKYPSEGDVLFINR